MSRNIRLNKVWNNMKRRCYCEQNDSYKDYGGRGISMCNEWLNDYFSFEQWAIENGWNEENLYKSGRNKLTIDRIDNNGNYEPSNCRIITNAEQQYNKRTNIIIEYNHKNYTVDELSKKLNLPKTTISTRNRRKSDFNKPYLQKKEHYFIYNDKKYSLSELVEISGLKRTTLYKRLVKLKWSIDKAINTKETKDNRKLNYCEYKGKQYSLVELSKISGISRDVLYRRIFELNWSVEKALNTKVINKKNNIVYEYNGCNYSLQELSNVLQISKETLYYRIKHNLDYYGNKKES